MVPQQNRPNTSLASKPRSRTSQKGLKGMGERKKRVKSGGGKHNHRVIHTKSTSTTIPKGGGGKERSGSHKEKKKRGTKKRAHPYKKSPKEGLGKIIKKGTPHKNSRGETRKDPTMISTKSSVLRLTCRGPLPVGQDQRRVLSSNQNKLTSNLEKKTAN